MAEKVGGGIDEASCDAGKVDEDKGIADGAANGAANGAFAFSGIVEGIPVSCPFGGARRGFADGGGGTIVRAPPTVCG